MNTNPKTGREGEEGGEQSKQNSKADWAKAPVLALENLSQIYHITYKGNNSLNVVLTLPTD